MRNLLWKGASDDAVEGPQGHLLLIFGVERNGRLLYKTTDYRAPAHDRRIAWEDPAMGIAWPEQGMAPALSGKDQQGNLLAEADVFSDF